jgi:hypothetical protein
MGKSLLLSKRFGLIRLSLPFLLYREFLAKQVKTKECQSYIARGNGLFS